MGFLVELWLPILVSSVLVFIASALAWMVSPHHKQDWKGLPNEDGFLDSLRANNTPAGQYMFPFCGDQKVAAVTYCRKAVCSMLRIISFSSS